MNTKSFIFSFSVCMAVPALTRASRTVLNRRQESGQPYLPLHVNLRVKAIASALSVKLAVGLIAFLSDLCQDQEIPY